jgi:hypothetical protein
MIFNYLDDFDFQCELHIINCIKYRNLICKNLYRDREKKNHI